MRKEIRRIVMFCTILTVGLLLLVFDVTFIQLLFLILGIAVILPFLLGLVTIAEVREAFSSFKEQKLKKISILKKLDEIKLFEKKGAQKLPLPPSKPPLPKAEPAAPKGAAAPAKGRFTLPFSSQISSIVSSFGSLGTVIREKTRRERKVEDINKMLDTTVAGKVEPAPSAAPAPAKGASLPAPPGGAGTVGETETDPFLSLSEDDLDTGLLDGLDESGDLPAAAPAAPVVSATAGESVPAADMGLPEPELSVPSPEIDAAASDILKAYGGDEGLDAFSGLDTGAEGSDADLGELDNLSLDDVKLDDEDAKDSGAPAQAPAAEPAPAAAPASGAPAAETSSAVKTAWIPSDAPKDADQQQDQIGTQSDMASFAQGASGTDEDLLSSIASDVKRTVKEKDISLLRELKDFKAPANQIETELTDMYQRLSLAQKPKDKGKKPTNEIK